MQRTVVVLILIPFAVLSSVALWQHGYWGIVEPHFRSTAGMQVLCDLVIALSLALVWLWRDAKALGRNPVPWIIATLLPGSFGPLVYLLTRPAVPLR